MKTKPMLSIKNRIIIKISGCDDFTRYIYN